MGYPGGKGKCYQRLINLMPPHRIYIETHVGGGAVLRHKRPAESSIAIDLDHRVAERWRRELRHDITLHQTDAVDFLERYAFVGDELIYCDPPYVPEVRRRAKIYRHDYTEVDHLRLLALLQQLPAMVMISGYASALYQTMLSDWRVVTFPAMTHTGIREECVWMNFPPPSELHDPSWMGSTFRQRQSINRRRARWVRKFEILEAAERCALLQELNDKFQLKGGAESCSIAS